MNAPGAPNGRREDELRASLEGHAESFAQRFGRGGPVRRFFSPGRINLMGAHLDYNGGPVMPMALDRGTFLALRPREDDRITLASTLEKESLCVRLASLPAAASGRWFDYPLGVIVDLLRDSRSRIGADVLFGGNLPIGAGLSSSASICVGTAFAIRSLWGAPDDPTRCIQAALWGEREWVGVQCGIMDPYAVALSRVGHVLWLDCKDQRVEHLPLDTEELVVAVVDTGIRRELAKGDFNRRVEECGEAFVRLRRRVAGARVLCDVPASVVEEAAKELGPTLTKRARHVVTELGRTRAAREALLAGDLAAFGRCATEAHHSLRDLFEVSIPELDCIVESACALPGVLGGRLTGAGFGGCAVVLLRRDAREGLAEHVQAEFRARFGRTPEVFFFRGDSGPREFA